MAEYKDIEQIKKHPYFDELHNCAYVNPNYRSGINKVLQIIDEMLTADVVEVVRCKDCVLYKPNYLPGLKKNDNCGICIRYKFLSEEYNFRVETDFCSYGERGK